MKGLSQQMRQWTQDNQWYKLEVISNRLKLTRKFGNQIRSLTLSLESEGRSTAAAEVHSDFKRLSQAVGVFDKLCRKGAQTEQELEQIEAAMRHVRNVAAEFTDLLEVLEGDDCDSGERLTASYVTFAEAADIIGVCKATISNWSNQGRLAHNGANGRGKKLLLSSVLAIKHQIENNQLYRDAQQLRQDAARIS